MLDLKATISALRSAGFPAEQIVSILECYQSVNSPVPVVSVGNPQETARLEKLREYDRNRKRAKAVPKVVPAEIPAENSTEIENSAYTLSSLLLKDSEDKKEVVTRARAQRGTSYPDNFRPSESVMTDARTRGLADREITDQLEAMKVWSVNAGAKGRKVDWDGFARIWLRKHASERKPNGKPYQSARQSHAESARASIASQRALIIGEGEDGDIGEPEGTGLVIEGDFSAGE